MPDINIQLLRQFSFQALFVDMGWDYPGQGEPYQVELDGQLHALAVVAHKRGVQILHALPDHAGHIPPYATRQKIERKITAQAREHLIVFTDAAQSTQIWQWVSRAPGRPYQYREVHWRVGESTELLRQKLSAITFTLGDEETLSVLGIAARLQAGFDRDKVTKKFYGEFEKQRKSFAEFIAGIPDTGEDLRWYTDVLIDRLMFLWFLQEKRFLDDKKDYLQQRLVDHVNAQHPISFYGRFLCPLFFRGFAEERTEANRATIRAEFGDVPYLNGGLFARHELEQRHGSALDVADAAFEKLFAFFAQWDWHLDDRPLEKKAGKADKRDPINPDVLGYIFEKFVNQKQMGAYYTKEPNGSGKSNVSDAIRWVLGEQSTKLLRAKKQEDVIFAGTKDRAAVGMAEVALTLDNEERWLPVDFAEVEIARRVYRNGDSEYLLNGSRVRLRDVVDLLMKGDVGQNSYSIMGQGLVDVVLSMSPDERRSFLDEAADVKRFRLKIREAMDRLAATRENIDRVTLIIEEIEPRLAQLSRQADRAADHKALSAELLDLLKTYYGHLWSEAQNTLVRARAALDQGHAENAGGTQRVNQKFGA